MQNFDSALHYINLARNNHKGEQKGKAKLTYPIISFIQATCLKMTNQLSDAKNAYVGLEENFKREQSKGLVNLLWGLLQVPLSNNRKVIADHYLYLKEYLEHLKDEQVPIMTKQNLLLSKYCIDSKNNVDHRSGKLLHVNYEKDPARLDFEQFPKSIWALLRNKSFFKRFNELKDIDKEKYEDTFWEAEVELYGKD